MTQTAVIPPRRKKLSFEQYLLLPYDGRRTEFVDGEVIEMAEPSLGHIKIVKLLGTAIDTHIEQHRPDLACFSGPGVAYPRPGQSDGARDPDLVIATNEQWEELDQQTKAIFLRGNPPLLAIEVVSPGTVKIDTHDKRADYADAKVPEYWVVNPVDGYVSVWVLDGRMYSLKGHFEGTQPVQSELLPQWSMTAEQMLGRR
jgi:Uma2 family endonuclease